jgi:hypothetical protein
MVQLKNFIITIGVIQNSHAARRIDDCGFCYLNFRFALYVEQALKMVDEDKKLSPQMVKNILYFLNSNSLFYPISSIRTTSLKSLTKMGLFLLYFCFFYFAEHI